MLWQLRLDRRIDFTQLNQLCPTLSIVSWHGLSKIEMVGIGQSCLAAPKCMQKMLACLNRPSREQALQDEEHQQNGGA